MARRDPETNPAAFLGDELRRARLAAGFSSQDALAAKLGFDRTVITKAETGERPPTIDVLAAWCQACRLDDELFGRLGVLARRAEGPLPAWFQDWVTHGEQLAERLRWFEPLVVPGLLQTEEYARALLTGRIGNHVADVEARVTARMDRQAVITREDDPAELLAVIDDGVLRRAVGGVKVMTGQIEYLIQASGRPNVVIQVIPAATAVHDGVNGGGLPSRTSRTAQAWVTSKRHCADSRSPATKRWRRWRWPSIGSGRRRCQGARPWHYWRRRRRHGAKPSELA